MDFEDIIGWGIMLLWTLPVWLPFMYILIRLFYPLYRKFRGAEKMNEGALQVKREKRKVLFYNFWLPSLIYFVILLFSALVWATTAYAFCVYRMNVEQAVWENACYAGGVWLGWLVIYLLYHFIWWICRNSNKYFNKKIFVGTLLFITIGGVTSSVILYQIILWTIRGP